MDQKIFDVLGLGSTTVDELLFVGAYPQADSKTRVLRRSRQIGGLTATALVASARLGCKTAYAGALGSDELSRFVETGLMAEGIDLSGVARRPDAMPIPAWIIVSTTQQTRTIFYDPNVVNGADETQPSADFIRSARVLHVDPYGMVGMIRAARIARDADIPIVADLESSDFPQFDDLLALADHLIIPYDFGVELAGGALPPSQVAERLLTGERKAVVITCGLDGVWYAAAAAPTARHQPIFPVETVDSTGCGDVFHGAYAAMLARGLALPERIRIASAAAAIKATQAGGQAGIPTEAAVQAFLRARAAL